MESLFQIAVCSAPRLIRTCFELDFDETEATSRFFGFFKLDRRGPCALPKKSQKEKLSFHYVVIIYSTNEIIIHFWNCPIIPYTLIFMCI